MEVKSTRSEPTSKGPEQFFTGTVHVAPLFAGTDPSRMSLVIVRHPFARAMRKRAGSSPCGVGT